MQSTTKNNDKGSQSRGHNTQPSPRKEMTRSFKTQGMLFGDLCPVEYDEELDPPVKACFNCWSFNHQRKYCPQPETYNYCCNCGRKGLTVEECPRCARAFHAMDSSRKDWIYRNFFHMVSSQTTPKKRNQEDKHWDDYYDGKQKPQKKDRGGEEYRDDYYDRKQKTRKKDSRGEEYWDDYDEDNCQSQSVESHVKNASASSKMNELKDEDFIWEPSKSYHSLETAYAEPHVLFDYIQHKKTIDEWKSEKMAVNLDETRMAEMDSLHENSILSIEDSPKKVDTLLYMAGGIIQDLLCLLKAVKHLSVRTQDVIVVQYMDERKQRLIAKGQPDLLKPQ